MYIERATRWSLGLQGVQILGDHDPGRVLCSVAGARWVAYWVPFHHDGLFRGAWRSAASHRSRLRSYTYQGAPSFGPRLKARPDARLHKLHQPKSRAASSYMATSAWPSTWLDPFGSQVVSSSCCRPSRSRLPAISMGRRPSSRSHGAASPARWTEGW